MASINYLYRSTRDQANLNLRLLYRFNNKDHVIGTKTNLRVSRSYWFEQHNLKRPKDVDIQNRQLKVNTELNKLTNHILDSFNNTDTFYINKDWLVDLIDQYYNPEVNRMFPNTLVEYIDTYVELKYNDLTKNTVKKFNVIKHKLQRFQSDRGRVIFIKDVDLSFKKKFEEYCIKENYALNTITRDLRFIKTFCNNAKDNGIEVSPQLSKIKTKYISVDSIYLNEKDISKIQNNQDLPPHLENAKNWLLISCFTGQRVSDFMRFKADMIRNEKGKPLLEFTQKKTNKKMTIPLSKQVLEILSDNNNQFPKPISDQKYNRYIKEVAKLSGITEKIKGSKKVEIKPDSGIYRKEDGVYEKCELVTSHIGRRSFATNYYGKIPTSFLIYMTGHSTETMFLNYIGKSNKDIALEMANYL